MNRVRVLSAVAVVVWMDACGGSVDEGRSGTGATGSGATGGVAGGGQDSGGATGGTSASGGATGVGGMGASGGATGGTSAIDATTGVGGSGGSGVGQVKCITEALLCDTGNGSVCCAELVTQGCAGGTSFSCHAAGDPPCTAGETTMTCDGPDDCPGQVCCGSFEPCSTYPTNRLYSDVSCRPAEECTGSNRVVLCDPTAAETCPTGVCTSHMSVPGTWWLCASDG